MAPQRSSLDLSPCKQIQCVLEVLGSAAVSEGSWKFGKFQFPAAAKVQVFQDIRKLEISRLPLFRQPPNQKSQHRLPGVPPSCGG